jgi:hypothetical protein
VGNIAQAERRARSRLKLRLQRVAMAVDRFQRHLSVNDLEAIDRQVDHVALRLLRMVRGNQQRVRLMPTLRRREG